MQSLREQLTGTCKHIASGSHEGSSDKSKTCLASVSYYELMEIDRLGILGCCCRLPCGGKTGEGISHCSKYQPLTGAEIQAEIDGWEKSKRCLAEDISSCCEAPIDHSRAIQDGAHAGHGPRYCSKCRKLAYMV